MASKKEKLLESAQRFVLKGQLDKAIKDYQQVVAMEPGEIRCRQRLAELLVRDHRKEEAIAQYEDIGKHYADNSYFLKAIAIYKQIQRLSPGDRKVSLTIAALNHQQGLVGNALAEYGQVVAQLEKEGDFKEALKVVEKMLGVDAEHVATRLKQAELLFANGAKDDSLQVLSALLSSLNARGRAADAETVSARIGELFPEQTQVAAAAEPAAEHSFHVEGFDTEPVPGVTDLMPAPWETQEPSPQPVPPEALAPEVDLPDAFAQPFAAQEEPFGPSPDSAESQPAAPPAAPAAPAEVSAWEEEIELDLDGDFALEFAAPQDLEEEDPEPAPEPTIAEPAIAEPAVPAPVPMPEAASQAGIDLHLDFSLNLDFDEEVHTDDEEPPDGERRAVVELDLEEESPLELSLPAEGAAPSAPWLEAGEPEEPARAEEPHLPEDFPAIDLAMPEELPDASEQLSRAVPEQESGPVRGWEEIYPGCDEAGAGLDLEELESHYDLGIGYKEMGMYAGAIKELDIAARNPQRRVTCLTLQAICYREKGEPEKAEDLLRRGLALDVLGRDDRTCLEYELAVLLEGGGALEEALALYREVRRVNPAYHDVAVRLSALSGEEHLDIIELELEEG